MENKAPKRIKYKGQIYEAVQLKESITAKNFYLVTDDDFPYIRCDINDNGDYYECIMALEPDGDSYQITDFQFMDEEGDDAYPSFDTDWIIDRIPKRIKAKLSVKDFDNKDDYRDNNTSTIAKVNVDDARLLSIEEAKKLPKDILKYKSDWWLRSLGKDSGYAAFVYGDNGDVNASGGFIDWTRRTVRPALIMPGLKSLNLELYSQVLIGDQKYIVISDDAVLYNGKPIPRRFDIISGNYDKSEIKEFIQNNFPNHEEVTIKY